MYMYSYRHTRSTYWPPHTGGFNTICCWPIRRSPSSACQSFALLERLSCAACCARHRDDARVGDWILAAADLVRPGPTPPGTPRLIDSAPHCGWRRFSQTTLNRSEDGHRATLPRRPPCGAVGGMCMFMAKQNARICCVIKSLRREQGWLARDLL